MAVYETNLNLDLAAKEQLRKIPYSTFVTKGQRLAGQTVLGVQKDIRGEFQKRKRMEDQKIADASRNAYVPVTPTPAPTVTPTTPVPATPAPATETPAPAEPVNQTRKFTTTFGEFTAPINRPTFLPEDKNRDGTVDGRELLQYVGTLNPLFRNFGSNMGMSMPQQFQIASGFYNAYTAARGY